MHNLPKAEKYFDAAIKQNRKSLAEDHPYIALNQYWLGKIYLESDRLNEAEKILRKSLKTRIKKYPKEHKDIWRAKSELGICLQKQKKYEEAVKILLPTLEYYKTNFSDDKEQIKRLYESSIDIYKIIGDLEKVEIFKTELEALSKEIDKNQ